MSVHYDKDTIEQIRQTDMTDFLNTYKGFNFKRQGLTFRCIEHNSLVVKDDKIRWFWNSKGIGGFGVIDYLMNIEQMTFPNAIDTMQNMSRVVMNTTENYKQIQKTSFFLPEKGKYPYIRLIDYLCHKRGIDIEIIYKLIQKNKIYQDIKGNIVFVGYDENNQARYASLRGTFEKQFRMDCFGSDKHYSFSIRNMTSKTLYIFESPIDLLSYLTLKNIEYNNNKKWKEYSCISLGGLSDIALDIYIKNNKSIERLVFCLDNDKAGKSVTEKLIYKYHKVGFITLSILPTEKDFNNDLIISKNYTEKL